MEYARQGIRINIICPGASNTPMVKKAAIQSPEHMKQVIDAIPIGRIERAEEIASTVLFLCSEQSGFAVGQVWAIDGGFTTM